MLLLAGLLLRLLAFGTLVAPVFSLQFNFTSVRRCAPTTALLTVGGDSSSPHACLSVDSTGTLSNGTSTRIFPPSSRIIAISSATIGGVSVLLGVCAAVYFFRKHRRCCRTQHLQFDSQRSPGAKPPIYVDNLSAQSLDIDGMLNMLQSDTIVNGKDVDPVFGSPVVPQPALSPTVFRSLSGRHLRAPSDVPADLSSRTCSSYSTIPTNPFHGYTSVTLTEPTSARTPTTPSLTRGRSINGRSIGLPSSPRDGPKANVLGMASKPNNTNTEEWYGGISR